MINEEQIAMLRRIAVIMNARIGSPLLAALNELERLRKLEAAFMAACESAAKRMDA